MIKKKTSVPVESARQTVMDIYEIVKEIRKAQKTSDGEAAEIVKGIWNLTCDLYCYADDLRIDAYRYYKAPSDPNKTKLVKQIAAIDKFHHRLELLEQMQSKEIEKTPGQKEIDKSIN